MYHNFYYNIYNELASKEEKRAKLLLEAVKLENATTNSNKEALKAEAAAKAKAESEAAAIAEKQRIEQEKQDAINREIEAKAEAKPPKNKKGARETKSHDSQKKVAYCFDFHKGACTRGDACKYKHALKPPAPAASGNSSAAAILFNSLICSLFEKILKVNIPVPVIGFIKEKNRKSFYKIVCFPVKGRKESYDLLYGRFIANSWSYSFTIRYGL